MRDARGAAGRGQVHLAPRNGQRSPRLTARPQPCPARKLPRAHAAGGCPAGVRTERAAGVHQPGRGAQDAHVGTPRILHPALGPEAVREWHPDSPQGCARAPGQETLRHPQSGERAAPEDVLPGPQLQQQQEQEEERREKRKKRRRKRGTTRRSPSSPLPSG